MATIRQALGCGLLAALLGAGPALAQGRAPGDPAAPQGARATTATGQTKPPAPSAGTASAPTLKPATEAEMIKAQKAAESRSKAWDSRMRRTMGSICSGC